MTFVSKKHEKLEVCIDLFNKGFSIGYSMQPFMYCSENFPQSLKNRDIMFIGYDPISIENAVRYSEFSEEILKWYEKNKNDIHTDTLAGFSEDKFRSCQRL